MGQDIPEKVIRGGEKEGRGGEEIFAGESQAVTLMAGQTVAVTLQRML